MLIRLGRRGGGVGRREGEEGRTTRREKRQEDIEK